jgi:hypothetical protein
MSRSHPVHANLGVLPVHGTHTPGQRTNTSPGVHPPRIRSPPPPPPSLPSTVATLAALRHRYPRAPAALAPSRPSATLATPRLLADAEAKEAGTGADLGLRPAATRIPPPPLPPLGTSHRSEGIHLGCGGSGLVVGRGEGDILEEAISPIRGGGRDEEVRRRKKLRASHLRKRRRRASSAATSQESSTARSKWRPPPLRYAPPSCSIDSNLLHHVPFTLAVSWMIWMANLFFHAFTDRKNLCS